MFSNTVFMETSRSSFTVTIPPSSVVRETGRGDVTSARMDSPGRCLGKEKQRDAGRADPNGLSRAGWHVQHCTGCDETSTNASCSQMLGIVPPGLAKPGGSQRTHSIPGSWWLWELFHQP